MWRCEIQDNRKRDGIFCKIEPDSRSIFSSVVLFSSFVWRCPDGAVTRKRAGIQSVVMIMGTIVGFLKRQID